MFLIFRPDLKDRPDFSPGSRIQLRAAELRHARARRLRDGDPLFLGDGRSRRWSGVLQGEEMVQLVFDSEARESVRLLCSAIPEGNRRDWLVTKATELGLTHFLPLQCERSGPQRLEADRFHRLVEEAAAQSRRFFLPRLLSPCTLSLLLQRIAAPAGGSQFMEEEAADITWLALHPAAALRAEMSAMENSYAFLVGPEGGFSAREIDLFAGSPVQICSLGPRILRLETAALAILSRYPGS